MGSRMFIAVQCCECWMMQVKQQKKSGNKWTCVVCNQKQSVRKVFAQGYVAKDLRQFVQSFNMSQSQKPQAISHQLEEEEQEQGGGLESRIETDMPNKKPKLSTNGADTGDGEGEEYESGERDSTICWPSMTKAVVSKWSKYLSEDDTETETEDGEGQQRTQWTTMAMGASKQKNYLTEDHMEPRRTCQKKVAKAASKWNDYVTTDDGEQRSQCPTTVGKSASKWNSYLTQEEEDIHPDFI